MASVTITKQLHVGGMTCVNCQNKIEQKLQNTAGVTAVSVSYSSGLAQISYDPDLISLKDIVGIIERLDYTVLPDQESGRADVSRIVCVLLIIICLYVLLERFGVLNLLVPSQLADTTMGYGMLFVIGLITSVHCIAMCGGINLSQCIPGNVQEERGGKLTVFRPALMYNLGRVASYTVIGFLLGALGMLLGGGSGAGIPTMLQGTLKLIAGLVMVIMGVNMLGLFPWLRKLTLRMPKSLAAKVSAQKARSRRPLVVGLLNGLMPCGPLQSMSLVALASGDPISGAFSMLLFSLGTVPLMLGLGSIVSALGKRFARAVMSVGAVLVVVLGLAMLSQGGSLSGLLPPEHLLIIVVALCVLAVVASLPIKNRAVRAAGLAAVVCVSAAVFCFWGGISAAVAGGGSSSEDATATVTGGVQVVNSTLSPGRYPNITVQAGIPVQWIIDAPEGSINGCNYKLIIREYGIEHTFQEGENIIEFTPSEPGTVQYSCWMGMIHASIFVTDADGSAIAEDGSVSAPIPAGYQIPSQELAVAETGTEAGAGAVQKVSIELTENGFQPAVVVVEAGLPVLWTVENSLTTEGGAYLLAPIYSTKLEMNQGENVLALYPSESFEVSTGDSAFYAYVKVVDDISHIDTAAIQAEVEQFETVIYPEELFLTPTTGASCCG